MMYFIFNNVSNYTHEFSLSDKGGSVIDGIDADNETINVNNPNRTEVLIESSESYIESMKNLLLYKIKPKIFSSDPKIKNIEETTVDRALAVALTDSSEIDLSPPNPIITREIEAMSNLVCWKDITLLH